jgi:RNA polymerase sigma-70 factor (ECF subfamily)
MHDDQSHAQQFRRQLVELIPRLRRFARSLTGSAANGDDLVQSTLERALLRSDQWEAGTRLDSWLYRIAQNQWIDQIRAAKVRGELADPGDMLNVVGVDGREATEQELMVADTRRAVAALPEQQRDVLLLVAVEGLSYGDAAQVLGIPIGTVMSRLARARKSVAGMVLGNDAVDA